ncbi:MAG: IclR family transcriptional regulator [Gammaproteobacteria bacterium]|nr:MAG: IclR family transcriptional regulator [Gammaproteobacteria bacterium]
MEDKIQLSVNKKPFSLQLEPAIEVAEGDRKFAATLAKGLDLLRAFQTQIGPLGNKELAELTGYPKSTITRLTYTLVKTGYLSHGKDGKFQISPRVLSLGYPLLVSQKMRHICHDYMAEIAALGNYTLGLAVHDGPSMVYIDECTGSSMNKLRLDIGARIEIVRSSVGRAYLSAIDENQRNQFFEQLAPVYGDEWPLLLPKIQQSLAEVEQRGLCLVDQEWRKDTRGVAVPLVSEDGKTVMALNCAAPVYSVSNETLEQEIGPRLVHTASNLSLLIGT